MKKETENYDEKYDIEKGRIARRIWENPPIPEGKRIIFECY